MPKANRTCYCCGQGYYYCPSCSNDRKDPRIYTMWDSEKCRDIFNTLVSESTKKITTLECKEKLIELGVNKNTKLKDSVRKHVDRVMSYEEDTEVKTIESIEQTDNEKENTIEVSESSINQTKTATVSTKKISRSRAKKNLQINKENSEVD